MTIDRKNIDKAASKILEDAELKAPSYLWDEIEERIQDKKKKKRALVIWLGAASWALVVSFGIGYFASSSKNTIHNEPEYLAETTSELKKSEEIEQNIRNKFDSSSFFNLADTRHTELNSEGTSIFVEPETKQVRLKQELENKNSFTSESALSISHKAETQLENKHLRAAQLSAMNSNELTVSEDSAIAIILEQSEAISAQESRLIASESNISKEDSLRIKVALKELEDAMEDEIIAYVEPPHILSNSNRWTFSGGLASMSQIVQPKEKNDLSYTDQPVQNYNPTTEYNSNIDKVYNDNLQNTEDSKGKIDQNRGMEGESMETSVKNAILRSTNTYNAGMNAEYEIIDKVQVGSGIYMVRTESESNNINYIEIPVTAKYILVEKKKFSMSCSGSYLPGFYSSNMLNSFATGLGLGYSITNQVGLNLEPRFKYISSGINQSQIGLQAGFFIKMK